MVNDSGSKRPPSRGGSRPSNSGSPKAPTSRAGARGAQGAGPAARRRRGSKKKSAHSLPFRIVRAVLLTLASLVLLAVLTFIGLYLFIDIPKANTQATQATRPRASSRALPTALPPRRVSRSHSSAAGAARYQSA